MPNQTGPNTFEGKLISSQNAAKHYMTSRQLVVQGENAADLENLLTDWHNANPTYDPIACEAVSQAATSDWFLRRAQRGYDKKMLDLYQEQSDQSLWTKEAHAEFQRVNRYLTAAKRTLDRDRQVILRNRRESRTQAREDRRPPLPRPAPAITSHSIPTPPPFVSVMTPNDDDLADLTPSQFRLLFGYDHPQKANGI